MQLPRLPLIKELMQLPRLPLIKEHNFLQYSE
jgi:hypothetical protein